MKAHIENIIDVSADEFYDKVFFDEAFSDALYKELKFRERELVVQEDRGDTIYREVRQVPDRDLPGAVKKLLGAARLEYVEKSTTNKAQNRSEIEVVSSIKPDKIKVRGAFWVEPHGEGKCKRVFDVEVKVSIFGVGGLVEKLVLEDVRKSYDVAADFTNQWLAEHA